MVVPSLSWLGLLDYLHYVIVHCVHRYRPEAMMGLREALRDVCASLRCCFALDAWDAAYVRAVDSRDGRHYETRTPTVRLTLNLLLNALAADCPS